MSEQPLYEDDNFDDLYDKLVTTEDDKLDRDARAKQKSLKEGSQRSQRSRSRSERRRASTKHKRSASRSKSRSRSKREIEGEADVPKFAAPTATDFASEDQSEQGASEQGEKRKKTKLEKIEQLQAKNALYKEEFKRVQKDRKQLKKDLEAKKNETESLGKEIDGHIAEISRLKNQLSQALQRGGGDGGDVNQEEVDLLRQQNTKAKSELDALANQIQNHNRDMESLNTTIRDKEVEISQLQEEAAELRKEIRETASENRKLVSASAESTEMVKHLTALEEENARLENELKETVEKASVMVKEREDAIADLLKENEDHKNEIARHENNKALKNGEEEEDEEDPQIAQLRQELIAVGTQLEETQDRNVILEEEVEGWVTRGAEMEKEVGRLQEELGEVKEKLETAEKNVEAAELRAERAMEAAHAADDALEEAEEEFEQAMAEAAAKHKAALLDVKTRYAEERTAASGNGENEMDQQAMLLQRAVSSRKVVPDNRRNTWFSFGNAEAAAAASNEEKVPEDEKIAKIQELEELVEERDEEIKNLKSELVQVRSSFNDTVYNNKKTMERLTHENETYDARVQELEKQLAEAINAASAT